MSLRGHSRSLILGGVVLCGAGLWPAYGQVTAWGTPAQWYNPNAFVLPAAGTWGNVGR